MPTSQMSPDSLAALTYPPRLATKAQRTALHVIVEKTPTLRHAARNAHRHGLRLGLQHIALSVFTLRHVLRALDFIEYQRAHGGRCPR